MMRIFLLLFFALPILINSTYATGVSEEVWAANMERLAKVKRIDDKINMEYRQFISPEFAQNFQGEENNAYEFLSSTSQSQLHEYDQFKVNSLFEILETSPDLRVLDKERFVEFITHRLSYFSEDRFCNAALLWDFKIKQLIATQRGVELSPLTKYQIKVMQDRYHWVVKAVDILLQMSESLVPQSQLRKLYFDYSTINMDLDADFYINNRETLDRIHDLRAGIFADENLVYFSFLKSKLNSEVKLDYENKIVQWRIGNLFAFKIPLGCEVLVSHHFAGVHPVDRIALRMNDNQSDLLALNALCVSSIKFYKDGFWIQLLGDVDELKAHLEGALKRLADPKKQAEYALKKEREALALKEPQAPEDDFLPEYLKKKDPKPRLKKAIAQKPKAGTQKPFVKKTKKVVKPKTLGKPKATVSKTQEEQKPIKMPQEIQLPEPTVVIGQIVPEPELQPEPQPIAAPMDVEEEPIIPQWLAYKHAKLNPKGERERQRQNRMVDVTQAPQGIEHFLTYQLKPKKQLLLNQMIAGKLEQKLRWEDGLNLVRKLIKQVGGKISSKKGNGSAVTITVGDISFLVHASHGFGPDMYPDQVRYLANGLMHAGIKAQ